MKHLYIAIFNIIEAPDPNPKFYSNDDILAENDEQALEQAMNKAANMELALDVIARNRLGAKNEPAPTKAVIVASIRDQVSRRTTYLNGYTIDE